MRPRPDKADRFMTAIPATLLLVGVLRHGQEPCLVRLGPSAQASTPGMGSTMAIVRRILNGRAAWLFTAPWPGRTRDGSSRVLPRAQAPARSLGR